MTCTSPCLDIAVHDELAFGDLRGEWDDLLQQSYDNRIFLTPVWYGLWWQHFGSRSAFIFVARGDDRRLHAVLPLMFHRDKEEQILTLVGDYHVADYMDGAASKSLAQESLQLLWEKALCDLAWDRVELRHVPSVSPMIPALQQVALSRGLSFSVEADEVCPVALLCSSWDGYLQMLTKKQRHEVRRKMRRAQEDVEWEWRTVITDEDLERDLPIFFRLHESGAGDKEQFLTAKMRQFFYAMGHEFLHAGVLRLSTFRRAGADVASIMSFLHRGRYLLYNSGYDPAYAEHSPGIAAIGHAMQDAIREKAVAFDFLSGNEPYKYQFGATDTHTCRVTVHH